MIDINIKGAKELAADLEKVSKNLPVDIAWVLNATATKVKANMAQQIVKEIPAKIGGIKKTLKVYPRANRARLGAVITLKETTRLSLKAFKRLRQTKKGVSYLGRGGVKHIPGGYMGANPKTKSPSLGGHARRRLGNARNPTIALSVASPWGAYLKNNMRSETVRVGEQALKKSMEKRIRDRTLGFVTKGRRGGRAR